MFRKLALAALLALPLAGAAMLAPDAALAQGCLSSKEARSAVQNGQAVSLSKMVKRIQKATGGEILPTPQLCNSGGRLVYIVKVLSARRPGRDADRRRRERRYLRLLTERDGERAMRILVVEDDADLNRQLVAALKEAGYVVDSAADGEEGHFLGDTEPYDAVVLDIGLPHMDGI